MSSSSKQTVRSTLSEPLCRPSRIPTAVGQKSVTSPSSWSVQHSPQHTGGSNKRTNANNINNTANGTFSQAHQATAAATPRFEAYMMTGDIILNISKKVPRTTNVSKPTKKTHSSQSPIIVARNGAFAPHAKYDSSPSSPSDDNSGGCGGDMNKISENFCIKEENVKSSSVSSSTSSSANNSSSTFSNDAVDCPLIKNSKSRIVVEKHSSINVSETSSVSSNEMSFSVPTSPTSLNMPNSNLYCKSKEEAFKMTSAPTSPDTENTTTQDFIKRNMNNMNTEVQKKRDTLGRVRTSRSEDPLRDGINNSVVPINIDEDFNSSLNTLLDTRNESDSQSGGGGDRIVWTYNAPIIGAGGGTNSGGRIITSPLSQSSSDSPRCSESQLASPTSPSSNEATSNDIQNIQNLTNDQSVSEVSAVSNISSPDYQDEQFSARELCVISDPSDSDSTILASEKQFSDLEPGNKIVIQVAGMEANNKGKI